MQCGNTTSLINEDYRMFPLQIEYDKIEQIMKLSEEAIEANSIDKTSYRVELRAISLSDILKMAEDDEKLEKAGIENSFKRLERYLHSLSKEEMSEITFLYYVGRGEEYDFETYQRAASDPKDFNINYIYCKTDLSKCLCEGLIQYKVKSSN